MTVLEVSDSLLLVAEVFNVDSVDNGRFVMLVLFTVLIVLDVFGSVNVVFDGLDVLWALVLFRLVVLISTFTVVVVGRGFVAVLRLSDLLLLVLLAVLVVLLFEVVVAAIDRSKLRSQKAYIQTCIVKDWLKQRQPRPLQYR
jgi:hypothetical protein